MGDTAMPACSNLVQDLKLVTPLNECCLDQLGFMKTHSFLHAAGHKPQAACNITSIQPARGPTTATTSVRICFLQTTLDMVVMIDAKASAAFGPICQGSKDTVPPR